MNSLQGSRDQPDALLLLHGALVGSRVWDPQIPAFSRAFRVLRPDLPGHGSTPAPAGAYTVAALADHVVSKLDSLRIARAHVCGHSLGGMVAQRLALDHPERVGRLVLAETAMGTATTRWERLLNRVTRGLLAAVPARLLTELSAWSYGRSSSRTRRFLRREMGRYPGPVVRRVMRAALEFDSTSEISRIVAPTLVLVAARNGQTHRQGRDMAERIPRAGYAEIPEAHHLLNMDNPEAFTRLVLAFLASE